MSNVVAMLEVKGIGSCPSFKNNKMIARGRLITNPKRQKWMDLATRVIESQLRNGSQITGDATSMGPARQRLIACAGQFDDSHQWMPEINLRVVKCAKGSEGMTIAIEEI